MLRRGKLERVIWARGTPTIMIGDVEDAAFEQHLREGPYVVFDDSARPRYKDDPRVHFVPGHPVLRTAMPELLRGLGVDMPGRAAMKWEQLERWGMHNVEFGTAMRKALTVARPLLWAGVALAGVAAAAALIGRAAEASRSRRS